MGNCLSKALEQQLDCICLRRCFYSRHGERGVTTLQGFCANGATGTVNVDKKDACVCVFCVGVMTAFVCESTFACRP